VIAAAEETFAEYSGAAAGEAIVLGSDLSSSVDCKDAEDCSADSTIKNNNQSLVAVSSDGTSFQLLKSPSSTSDNIKYNAHESEGPSRVSFRETATINIIRNRTVVADLPESVWSADRHKRHEAISAAARRNLLEFPGDGRAWQNATARARQDRECIGRGVGDDDEHPAALHHGRQPLLASALRVDLPYLDPGAPSTTACLASANSEDEGAVCFFGAPIERPSCPPLYEEHSYEDDSDKEADDENSEVNDPILFVEMSRMRRLRRHSSSSYRRHCLPRTQRLSVQQQSSSSCGYGEERGSCCCGTNNTDSAWVVVGAVSTLLLRKGPDHRSWYYYSNTRCNPNSGSGDENSV
jgi:hypothetical protein